MLPLLVPLFAALVLILGGAIAAWIANRPDTDADYSTEEIEEELERAFVERKLIKVLTTLEYLPIILEKVHLTVDTGFPENQIAALLHRIQNRRTFVPDSAVYPVEIGGLASDLDLQWLTDDSGRIEIAFNAVPAVIDAIEAAAKQVPSSSQAQS